MGPLTNDQPKPPEDGGRARGCQAPGDRTAANAEKSRILVIRLSALGDFIMALPAMMAIRRAHPDASITLLTTAPLAELGRRSGWFDQVEIDPRPRWRDAAGWLKFRRWLRGAGFERVYDLQSQDRTALYFRLFFPGPWPEWSGIARGASHPHRDPHRRHMHAYDIHAAQLRIAGIREIGAPDLAWLDDPAIAEQGLPRRIALLVPGSAPHRPAKRWPAARFGALARILSEKGVTPIVVGAQSEHHLAAEIRAACPEALDLTGRTSLFAIAGLARRAEIAFGNDTGPMHLAALLGCRCVSLFSAESNPARSAPRGRDVTVLRRPDLADLPVAAVAEAAGL
jgi:ADP-heptose:LPS heptosyltransferase